MWIFFNDCYLSIKRDPSNPCRVIVRARTSDHIDAFIGNDHQITHNSDSSYGYRPGPDDYAFHAVITTEEFKALIIERIDQLEICRTWRDSIVDPTYHDVCNRVRKHIHSIQIASPYRFYNDPENQ